MTTQHHIGRLAKHTLTYGLGQALSSAMSLLLLPLFTAYLSPADYGVLSIVAMLGMIVTPIFSLGAGAATGLLYFDRGDEEHHAATIWTIFTTLLISVIVLGGLGLIIGPALSTIAFKTPVYTYIVVLSILGNCVSILTVPLLLYLQFENRVRTYVAVTVTAALLSISICLLLVIGWQRGVHGMVEGQLVANLCTLAILLVIVIRCLPIRWTPALVRDFLRHGLPLVPSFAALFVLQQGNKWILQWSGGLDALGVYSIGFNLGMAMNLAITAFTNAWVPYFLSYSNRRDEARLLFGQIFTYFMLGFGALSLFFYIGARPAVLLMTRPAFHDAYRVVGPTASAQLLVGMFSLLLPGMYFQKEVQYVTIIQGVAALMSVLINLLLVEIMGPFGAALGLVAGYILLVWLQYVWNRAHRKTYLEVVYEWRRVGPFVLFYIVFAAILLIDRELSLLSEALIALLAVAALLVGFYQMLTISERSLLKNFYRANIVSLSQMFLEKQKN